MLFAASLILASCSSGGTVDPGSDASDGPIWTPPGLGGSLNTGASYPGVAGNAGVGGGEHGGAGQGGDGGNVAVAPPVLTSTVELCKLINDVNQQDPTANATHTRANLQGTDLGIPVAHGSDLYFFFGDSVGYKVIWPFAESVPDAVGYAADGRAAVAADPSVLCDGLRFLRVAPGASAGPTVDPAIEADFAAGAMYPPSGHALSEYIKNPSGPVGQNAFPALPGSFEVPSGAFSHGGSIWAFYTTVESPTALEMKASYLAKWPTPSTTGTPNYDIIHRVDERFSGPGPLGGNFINIAAEPNGAYVYMFGTGPYRQSPIHLARKPLASLATAGGYEVFDAASGDWLAAPATSAAPIISEPTFGETSFRYFADVGLWMFMAHAGHRVVARFASQPEGPWSSEITIHDNTDPAFLAQYCCVPENNCSGERLFNCSHAGFYGIYLLPDLLLDTSGFTVSYTMSTWSPYNVALFSARFDN
ncbi:MAG: DUF4185 domain-containing protein [Myxococcales bacterium]|nr:DUF4185 domain-containing protein [Myxococcales bacterium]